MNPDEEAAISYEPDDDDGIQATLAEAERQLLKIKGVKGMGRTKAPTGEDVIVVYVKNKKALSRLPAVIEGYSIVGEVVGEVRIQEPLTDPHDKP